LNGALELPPQSIASMAIISPQITRVCIGKAHGVEADKTQIRDLPATLGVRLTGQYLEQIGRKLIGGLFGTVPRYGGFTGAWRDRGRLAVCNDLCDWRGRAPFMPGS
jgi:uncharacterized protein (DUF697 family)